MRASLRIGTRASPLARTQSGWVAERLARSLATEVELVDLTTFGDVSREPLAEIGGTGVFVTAVRDALLPRPGRRGRPLVEGPAHPAGAAAHAGCGATA
jgi:porphobilinogen deaminase